MKSMRTLVINMIVVETFILEGILSKSLRRHVDETQSDLSSATQDAANKQQTDKCLSEKTKEVELLHQVI